MEQSEVLEMDEGSRISKKANTRAHDYFKMKPAV